MEIAAFFILTYIIVIFGLSRFVISHLNSRSENIPAEIPDDMERIISELKARSKNAGEFLSLGFNFIGDRYRSERFNTVLKSHYLFFTLEKAWPMSGYMPCTISNYLLTIFLAKSGFFRVEDIKKKHVFVNFVPHQYLRVRLADKWIDVDVGEKQRGMPIGKHLKWFG